MAVTLSGSLQGGIDVSYPLRAIRGGTGVREDSKEAIRHATMSLFAGIIKENSLAWSDVECLWFTMTSDLTSEIPPLVLREEGINIPALCAAETEWQGQPQRTIRVLALARIAENVEIQHVFQKGASRNRPES